MGASESQIYTDEKRTWREPHSLDLDMIMRVQHLRLLENFGTELQLCYMDMADFFKGVEYRHYFILSKEKEAEEKESGAWIIELSPLQRRLLIHPNPYAPFQVEASFRKDETVTYRMQQVCGARGFSVALRNSEHLARFLCTKAWFSKQTVLGMELRNALKAMPAGARANLNSLPEELEADGFGDLSQIYPVDFYKGFVRFTGRRDRLIAKDEDAYNVLLLGPTGKGKSRIGNLIFGQTVFQTGGSPASVTRQIEVAAGVADIYDSLQGKLLPRQVNVIDTIGLCDSELTDDEVIATVKEFVKVNFLSIDRVVVVCGDRVEKPQVEGLKRVMKWLRYDQRHRRRNFLFLCNKSDLLKTSERDAGVLGMLRLIGCEQEYFPVHREARPPSETLEEVPAGSSPFRLSNQVMRRPLAIPTGFPDIPFDSVRKDLHSLLDAVFIEAIAAAQPSGYACAAERGDNPSSHFVTRLDVTESSCSIL
mmetsp:Transcript_9602/g.17229  ORF Transcript_9602/g.17229 Transcript_9602/m.17229 type:complete len:479 (-) Transcript_9602:60-1496(-)